MYKVFLSQPMWNRSSIEIKVERDCVLKYLNEKLDEKVQEIDSLFDKTTPHSTSSAFNEGIYFLGRSIELMAEADFVVFLPFWADTRGCQIEYEVALKYNKPILIIPNTFFADRKI